MRMRFSKMHGLGNDFVVIDAINQPVNLNSEQIKFMADRHFGIGFDQLLLVEKAVNANADFKYRIFNADGGEVAQCGNGARCFARFVREKKLSDKDDIIVDTDKGQLALCFVNEDSVRVNMGVPLHEPRDIPLLISEESRIYTVELDGCAINFAALSLGNPHAVIQVDDITSAPLATIGAAMECHALFPARANIGFMQIINRNSIKLRVYERGVGETMACGSGACAAVVAGVEQNLLERDVRVDLQGGELDINWAGRGKPVIMTGRATMVYDGNIEL